MVTLTRELFIDWVSGVGDETNGIDEQGTNGGLLCSSTGKLSGRNRFLFRSVGKVDMSD